MWQYAYFTIETIGDCGCYDTDPCGGRGAGADAAYTTTLGVPISARRTTETIT